MFSSNYTFVLRHNKLKLSPFTPRGSRQLFSYCLNTFLSRKANKKKRNVNNKILVDLTLHSQSQNQKKCMADSKENLLLDCGSKEVKMEPAQS